MKILVLSDTHIPRVAQDLPRKVYEEASGCDLILHAGDFVEKDLLDRLKKLKTVQAVYGNMDNAELRRILKDKEIVQAGAFRIGLIHGYGAPKDLTETVRKEFQKVDAIVFGHSHTAINTVIDGVLLFNPGSPTDNIFASTNSYGVLEVNDDGIAGKIVTL